MRRLRPLLLGSLTLVPHVTFAKNAPLLGVAADAELRNKFEGTGMFACSDGSGSVPVLVVNDEWCDCADGSDEPGTGACAGVDERLFYCPNDGGTPRNLYASRVGDGICDCCDGSDEASLASRRPGKACPNTCAEDGKREREALENHVAALKLGVEKRKQIEAKAVEDKKQWRSDIVPLEAEVKELNSVHEAAKKTTATAEEAQKAAQDVVTPPAPVDVGPSGCMWRQTAGCKADGDKESANDLSCSATIPAGMSGYCDCNGDGIWQKESEAGYDCSGDPGTCAARCKESKDKEAAPDTVEPAAVEKEEKVVSEYAKWMDGAAETLGSAEEKEAAPEQMEANADAAATSIETAASQADAVATEEVAEDPEIIAAKAHLEVAKAAHTAAKDAEREARRKWQDKKNEVSDLQNKINAVDDEHLGYASLIGKTIEKHIGEFNYKADFFTDAKQGHTRLGKWKGFTGPKSATFENGETCWNGPARSLLVTFVCDIVEELVDVNEPSRCVYAATIKHPGACDPKELEAYSGKRVVGPKDEL